VGKFHGLKVTGYGLRVTGYWLLVTGYWLLVIGNWLRVTGWSSGFWVLGEEILIKYSLCCKNRYFIRGTKTVFYHNLLKALHEPVLLLLFLGLIKIVNNPEPEQNYEKQPF